MQLAADGTTERKVTLRTPEPVGMTCVDALLIRPTGCGSVYRALTVHTQFFNKPSFSDDPRHGSTRCRCPRSSAQRPGRLSPIEDEFELLACPYSSARSVICSTLLCTTRSPPRPGFMSVVCCGRGDGRSWAG